MNILHVLDHSLPIHSGYSFRTDEIIRAQHKIGLSVTALTGPKHYAVDEQPRRENAFEYYRCPYTNGFLAKAPIVKQLEVIRLLRGRIRELVGAQDIDVIHAHSPSLDGIAAIMAARPSRVPVLYEMRASWEDAAVDHGTTMNDSARYKAARASETWVLKRAAGITTICQGLKESICERGIESSRVSVVPNAVDTERFKPSSMDREELRSKYDALDRFVVAFCGSFYAYEGLDLLVETVKSLVARHPQVLVLLAGGGEQEDSLRERVRALDLGEHIRFLGRVTQETVIDLYSLADVCVFPRHRNRLTDMVTPLKPLEAMATGALVLASDVGGHKELIADGQTGLLFSAGSKDDLEAALGQIYENPSASKLGITARRFVSDNRNWRSNANQYQLLYERVTAAYRNSPQ